MGGREDVSATSAESEVISSGRFTCTTLHKIKQQRRNYEDYDQMEDSVSSDNFI